MKNKFLDSLVNELYEEGSASNIPKNIADYDRAYPTLPDRGISRRDFLKRAGGFGGAMYFSAWPSSPTNIGYDKRGKLHWIAMSPGLDVRKYCSKNELTNLRDIGVEAIMDSVTWYQFEPGYEKFNYPRVDEAYDLVRSAGLGYILQLGLQNPPHWLLQERPELLMRNKVGKTLPNAPPSFFHPDTLPLVSKVIKTALFRVKEKNYELDAVCLSVGHLGECFYPHGENFYAFDESTIKAWRKYICNPEAMPFSEPKPGDKEYELFISWWYRKLYDYAANIFALGKYYLPKTPFIVKNAMNRRLGQIPERLLSSIDAWVDINSFGGPIFLDGGGVAADHIHISHKFGKLAMIESFLVPVAEKGRWHQNTVSNTIQWLLKHKLDYYNHANLKTLVKSIGRKGEQFELLESLIKAINESQK